MTKGSTWRVRCNHILCVISFVTVHNSISTLRFGDQILQIDGETLAGYSSDKVMKILKNASSQRVVFAVRDRLDFNFFSHLF